MTYNELKNEENKYVMNTYGRFPIALDHGEGATVWDVEGKKYIDLTSGIGVNRATDRMMPTMVTHVRERFFRRACRV